MSIILQERWADPVAIDGDVSPGEVARALDTLREDVKEDLSAIRAAMDRVVYRDVFTAELHAVELKMISMEQSVSSAKAMSFWAIGMFVVATMSAIGSIIYHLVTNS